MEITCQQFYQLLNNPPSSTQDVWRLHQLSHPRQLVVRQAGNNERVDLQTQESNTAPDWKNAAKQIARLQKTTFSSKNEVNVTFGSASKSFKLLPRLAKYLRVTMDPSDLDEDVLLDPLSLHMYEQNSVQGMRFIMEYLTTSESFTSCNEMYYRNGQALLLFVSANEEKDVDRAKEMIERYLRIRDVDIEEANIKVIGVVTDKKAKVVLDKPKMQLLFPHSEVLHVGPFEEDVILASLISAYESHLKGELERKRRRPKVSK